MVLRGDHCADVGEGDVAVRLGLQAQRQSPAHGGLLQPPFEAHLHCLQVAVGRRRCLVPSNAVLCTRPSLADAVCVRQQQLPWPHVAHQAVCLRKAQAPVNGTMRSPHPQRLERPKRRLERHVRVEEEEGVLGALAPDAEESEYVAEAEGRMAGEDNARLLVDGAVEEGMGVCKVVQRLLADHVLVRERRLWRINLLLLALAEPLAHYVGVGQAVLRHRREEEHRHPLHALA
mmetsp:Transcript_8119/g.34137  ORF Transcript_8119/g.34137 Transcript_8119/m.34137 type:complete len:232 (-) Transcript_8119:522-1217(-)